MGEFECPYQKEETTKRFYQGMSNVKACEEKCPVNEKICFRWGICTMAKCRAEQFASYIKGETK
jgi:hypothetical protein